MLKIWRNLLLVWRFGVRGKNQRRDKSHLQGRESCVPGTRRFRQETSGKLQKEPDGRRQERIKQLCLSVLLSNGQEVSRWRVSVLCSRSMKLKLKIYKAKSCSCFRLKWQLFEVMFHCLYCLLRNYFFLKTWRSGSVGDNKQRQKLGWPYLNFNGSL